MRVAGLSRFRGLGVLSGGGACPLHYLQRFAANVGAAGSFDPTIVVSAGGPTPVWTVVDGAGTATYTTAAITHVQTGAGNMQVSLGPPSILGYITSIDMRIDGLMGVFSQADLLRLPALAALYIQDNGSVSCRFRVALLLPTFLTLYAQNTASVITGTLSDLPAGMESLVLYGNGSAITGGVTALAATGVKVIVLSYGAKTQAQVDEIIARIYADRALFTAATPMLGIGGNNAAPSGVYQTSATPSTGKEMIYALVNDPNLEGFHKWTATFTA